MALNPACQTFVPLLSPYIDGELTPSERVTIERHLSACKDCTMRTADLRAEAGLVRIGMEMLADEVDFKDFAQQVMARVTPEKPPLWERIRLSLSEMFTYQRGPLLASLATATALLVVGLPFLFREQPPLGYAAERMMVQTVTTDEAAHVAPVVLETKSGNAIIWLVDHKHEEPQTGPKVDDEAGQEELDLDPSAHPPVDPLQPKGGEL